MVLPRFRVAALLFATVILVTALALLGACGGEVSHREATLVWQALVEARTVEPMALNAVAGRAGYVAPIFCGYAGTAESFTLHTFVATHADEAAPAELTGYVRYELRGCQPHKDAPALTGSLRRGLQSRRAVQAGEVSESSYDHLSGTLTLSGPVHGSCVVDLHRTSEAGRAAKHEGVLCGLPADHVAR